jgi:flavin reductase (DIM6/NTAB) family NADH-FMN oxidoreductase RutF
VAKDSLRTIRETGEFVVHVVTEELAELANLTSAELPPEQDEWDTADLRGAPSRVVAPQRVAASPAAFECRVKAIVDLGSDLPTNSLVIGEVLRIHVDDAGDRGRLTFLLRASQPGSVLNATATA